MRENGAFDDANAAVLIGSALNEPFMLEGVEAVNDRLVRSNLAAGLDLSDQGRVVVLGEILANKVEYRLLFVGGAVTCQTGLRQ